MFLLNLPSRWFLLLVFSASSSVKCENGSDVLPIFEDHLIVPHLFPFTPKDFCTVIYKPGLIIATGKFYFPYQVESLPEITWEFKYDKFYTLIAIEAIQKENFEVTTTTENVNFQGVLLKGILKKINNDPSTSNSTKNVSLTKPADGRSPPDEWGYRWVVVDIEENDIASGISLQQPYSLLPKGPNQPNSTHHIIYAFAIFEQSKKFDLEWNDDGNFFQQLLRTNFTPLANFARDFYGRNSLVWGNFFYVVPKPHAIVDNSPVEKIRWLT